MQWQYRNNNAFDVMTLTVTEDNYDETIKHSNILKHQL